MLAAQPSKARFHQALLRSDFIAQQSFVMRNRLIVLLLLLLTLPFSPWACAPEELPSSGRARITVEEDGIYRLTYSALRETGLNPKGIEPSTVRLTNRGQEVPIRIVGKGDDSSIEFYGTANESRYSRANVYWLTIGQAAGKTMDERPVSSGKAVSPPFSFSATLHREEDSLYWPVGGRDHPDYFNRLRAYFEKLNLAYADLRARHGLRISDAFMCHRCAYMQLECDIDRAAQSTNSTP